MSATSLDNLAGLRYLLLNEVFTLSHLVIVKLLGIEFASVQIVFIRCLSSAVLLGPLLAWQGSLGEIRVQLGLNTLRVLLSSVAITIHFFTISQIQLAQMSTIGYLRPAVTSLIAYFFLKESQSWHRWLVIVIGFAAVLFIEILGLFQVFLLEEFDLPAKSPFTYVLADMVIDCVTNDGSDGQQPEQEKGIERPQGSKCASRK